MKTALKIKTIQMELYSAWAPYLINSDESGYSEDEIAEIESILEIEELGNCLDVSLETFYGAPDTGKRMPQGELATYTFTLR
jgi:hypothetical protein